MYPKKKKEFEFLSVLNNKKSLGNFSHFFAIIKHFSERKKECSIFEKLLFKS